MERPFSDSRPFGPFVYSSSGMPRPDPPESGRTGRRSREEVIEFMDKAYNHPWTQKQAKEMFEGLTMGNVSPEDPGSQEIINLMKVTAAAGIIAGDTLDDRRTRDEIVSLYVEERNIEVPGN